MEAFRRRIILQSSGKSICQLTRWVHISAQNICCRQAAFNSSLPGQEHRGYLFIFFKPGSIQHTAYIQDNRHMRKRSFDLFHHFLFCFRETEIPIFKDFCRKLSQRLISPCKFLICDTLPVPPFSGIPAYGYNSCIRKCLCLAQQFLRHFWLQGHSRTVSPGILILDLLFIVLCCRPEHFYLSFLLLDLQAFHKVSGISHCHITAAAAAFYIVHTGFAKDSQLLSLLKRQQRPFIFQQYHTF